MTRNEIGTHCLVATINEALRRRIFTLSPGAVICPAQGFRFQIGEIPAIGHASDVGFDEVAVSVICWPSGSGGRGFGSLWWDASRRGDFSASGWLERRTGQWLQRGGRVHYLARDRRAALEAIPPIEPQGFAPKGRFFL